MFGLIPAGTGTLTWSVTTVRSHPILAKTVLNHSEPVPDAAGTGSAATEPVSTSISTLARRKNLDTAANADRADLDTVLEHAAAERGPGRKQDRKAPRSQVEDDKRPARRGRETALERAGGRLGVEILLSPPSS